MKQKKWKLIQIYKDGIMCRHNKLNIPTKRKKTTIYVVDLKSDLFHKSVPFDFILDVFKVMAQTPQHTYQILTKNHEKASRFFYEKRTYLPSGKNVLLG